MKLRIITVIMLLLTAKAFSGGAAFMSTHPLYPSDIPNGLVYWTDASKIVGLTNAAPVTTWTDSSAQGNSVTNSGTACPSYRTNIRNSLPAVRFDGVNDLLGRDSNSSLQVTNLTVCAVASWLGGGSGSGVVLLKNATLAVGQANYTLYEDTQQSTRQFSSGITTSVLFGGPKGTALTNGQFYQMSWTYDGAIQKTYLSGTLDLTSTVNTGNIATTTGSFQIGGYNGSFSGAEFGNMDECETAMWNRPLSDTERQGIEVGMKNKWGL